MKTAAQMITLEDAAALVSAGDGIWVGNALSIENPFIELLSYKDEEIKSLTIVGSTYSKADDIFDPKYSGSMRIVSIHNLCRSGEARESFQPEGGQLYQSICRIFGINTVALRVSPPDENGCCSVETDAADLNGAICGDESIRRRIAMLDMSLPVSSPLDGCAKISIKDFDYICSYKSRPESDCSIA